MCSSDLNVTKADTTAVAVSDGVLATWCGNVNANTNEALTGSQVSSLAGIGAYCLPLSGPGSLTATTTVNSTTGEGAVEVTGTLSGLPAGAACRSSAANVAAGGGPVVIPCVLVVANLAQAVALSLPLVNITTAQVAGALAAPTYSAVVSECSSAAPAPSRGCPTIRPTTGLPGTAGFHPVAFGGIGFYKVLNNALNPANPATWVSGNELGVVKAGDVSICTDKAGTSCATTGLSALGAAYASATAGSPVGQIGGGLTITATPGDYFLKIKYTHYALTADLSGVALAIHTPIGATGGVLAFFEQTQMAAVKVLAAPACGNLVPTSGGVGATTSISCTGLDPYQAGTVEVLDGNNFQLSSTDVTSSSAGEASASSLAAQYPAAKVKVTFAHGGESGAAFTVTKNFDSTAVSACSDAAACSAALITSTTVLPGNVALFIDDPTFALDNVDLSTIDLSDSATWYPLSPAVTSPVYLIGDQTGSNAGFAVTGAATDMHGATVKANTIPATDIWASNIACDVYGALNTANTPTPGNDSFGVITAGGDMTPDMDSDANPSPFADGSADLCSVAADANGREGGLFELQFDVQAAGRVNTAADDYAGLIIITVTSAP